jgi:hypothetical protein
MLSRFKKLCDRLGGYKIVRLTTRLNGELTCRPDILRVERHGEFVMVIPRRMYGFPIRAHRDLARLQHPDYFMCERILFSKHYAEIKKI